MLSSVLSSDRAIEVNIGTMRAFVHLRELLGTAKELARNRHQGRPQPHGPAEMIRVRHSAGAFRTARNHPGQGRAWLRGWQG